MRLLVSTPLDVIVDTDDACHIRAEDTSGAFGILPGHADFLTTLTVSVITWQDSHGQDHHIAVRRGILSIHDGNLVKVATRDAVGEESLKRLGKAVLERFREEVAAEDEARTSATRLHLATIRQLQRYLTSRSQAVPQPRPPMYWETAGEAEQ
ncbi:F0F1 ATP synthase subunit epsilon [Aestuariispira ectoiniformans]|uniref:F0F1 ATP synthase subunit epsilon n=1 Tax=Aestuariispira ectoiniformans TaxID=2775080 RepID=UPI00223BF1C5|nr:F0F1 ATP synthase subunit epsilon [Aestuariispira ectoiniformans]